MSNTVTMLDRCAECGRTYPRDALSYTTNDPLKRLCCLDCLLQNDCRRPSPHGTRPALPSAGSVNPAPQPKAPTQRVPWGIILGCTAVLLFVLSILSASLSHTPPAAPLAAPKPVSEGRVVLPPPKPLNPLSGHWRTQLDVTFCGLYNGPPKQDYYCDGAMFSTFTPALTFKTTSLVNFTRDPWDSTQALIEFKSDPPANRDRPGCLPGALDNGIARASFSWDDTHVTLAWGSDTQTQLHGTVFIPARIVVLTKIDTRVSP